MSHQKLLVRMPNWIGDFIMALPLLHDLKRRFPDALLTVMCLDTLTPLLQENPFVDDVFTFSKTRKTHDAGIIDRLRKESYDVGILVTNSFSSAWWLSQGGIKQTVGFKRLDRWFLVQNQQKPIKTSHQVDEYKTLLTSLGLPVSETAPELFLSSDEKEQVHRFLLTYGLSSADPVLGVNPGAAYGLAKCWPPERFREVIREMARTHAVLVFGDASMVNLVDQMTRGMPEDVINLAGKTSLRQLCGLIGRCQLFLTNDSGPMHIADSLGIPLVALFGSTDAKKTGPYRQGTVLQKEVECSPCFERECPIDFRCMKGIQVDEVLKSLKGQLV